MSDFVSEFYRNFCIEKRWLLVLKGLGTTLEVTFLALMLGIAIGFLIAIVRSSYEQNDRKKTVGDIFLRIGNLICKIYITVIRGTPTTIQIMIMYFVIFASSNNKIMVGMLAFGFNSGAYVAEIMRSGIMSLDKGQMEAGRSLGLNYRQTMGHIILPQALKNALPPLVSEFIVLLKETSIAGLIALPEMTYRINQIKSITYTAMTPLLVCALIYLIVVMILTFFMNKLERRLRSGER